MINGQFSLSRNVFFSYSASWEFQHIWSSSIIGNSIGTERKYWYAFSKYDKNSIWCILDNNRPLVSPVDWIYFRRNLFLWEIQSNWTSFLVPNSRTAIKRDPLREKVLAQLLPLTVQLKYLQIEQFGWLLHVVQYVSLPFIFSWSCWCYSFDYVYLGIWWTQNERVKYRTICWIPHSELPYGI